MPDAKNSGSRIVKYAAYRAMPWRNGRGSTLEIAREPVRGAEFSWRLSLADIDGDADFSAYPGHSRALVLVAGKSLRLRFRGHGRCALDPTRRSTRFEGDWQTHCAVPEGRCTDLSLIVRRGPTARPGSVVRAPTVLRVKTTRQLVLAEDLHGALFVLEGSVVIGESTRARTHTVRALETLLLPAGPRRILTIHSRSPTPSGLVMLRWRPA